MARVLVVYHRPRFDGWRSTYESHVSSFRRFSNHEVFYLNTDYRKVPRYLRTLQPDLVIYHYTFLAYRQIPSLFETLVQKVEFTRTLRCAKALIPHDEQAHSDLLSSFAIDFGVTHIFTPAAPAEWPKIYEGVDLDAVVLHTVLTGYVDEATLKAATRRDQRLGRRPIDIGYRSWATGPYYGRHGLLKRDIGLAVSERAPAFELTTDISGDYQDALFGESWLHFLLDCKYTIGVEGGSSVFDRDGSIAECVLAYMAEHTDAPFEEVERACFPGVDGHFSYFLLGPRHFEAIMTRTCQILVEGQYGGALQAGKHYIPLKKDFSNLDEVLQVVKDDRHRAEIVERAYQDVVASGKYSYAAFSEFVLGTALGAASRNRRLRMPSLRVARNRISQQCWWFQSESALQVYDVRWREALRPMASRILGEHRLQRALAWLRARRPKS